MQDVNTDRYPSSDALKLFLAQGLTSLYDKNLIVFALNSPYYLDTTEINKLTAYFALYSETTPHLEVAARALFGEADPQGASPVSVDGVNYDLVRVLSPDPIRSFPVQVKSVSPSDLRPPVTVVAQAGPILDYNGNLVPDGTPVEFDVAYMSGEKVNAPPADTIGGMAETTFILNQPGSVEIYARSDEAVSQRPQMVTAASAPETPTPTTAAATSTAATAPTPSAPAPTPAPTDTKPAPPTPTVVVSTTTPTAAPIPTPSGGGEIASAKKVSGGDFLLALGTIFLTFAAGMALWQSSYRSSTRRTRLVLVIFIGGMVGYLLYGIGWLRPDLWLNPQPAVIVQRATLFALVLLFGVAGIFVEQRVKW